ncbi:MAG: ABC transporter permease [Candidatus Acidiferrum sp.]|jgi:predicted permease
MWTRLEHAVARFRALFTGVDLDHDLDEELDSHVAMLTEENMRRGMSEREALRSARLQVGSRASTKQLHREVRGLPWLETLAQDLRYTVRTLRRDASLAVFAILVVGLGIGASTTIFSVVNALLLRPLPFRDPAQLVWVKNHPDVDANDLSGQTTQVGHLLDLRERSKSFSEVGAYMAFYGIGDNKLLGEGEVERLTNVPVSQNFFSMLGVRPMLGRQFTAEEASGHGPSVVMLGHNLWQRRFAGDPHIVGRSINLDGKPSTIVGVLPASFDFGNIFVPGTKVDLYSPFPLTAETNKWGNTMAVIARLGPGVPLATAQAESTILARQMTREHPERNDFAPALAPLSEHISGRVRPALILLVCAVGVVMLIVCANLSNLLLARGASRQKEIAIRSALGATKTRLVRQMLTESVVLACCGAALGLVLAVLGTRALSHLSGVTIPLLENVHVDAKALVFTLLIAVATGVLFGLVPALHVSDKRLQGSLKDASRGSSQGRGHAWVRNALVVSEIALACVLVVGAGLLVRSFLRVMDVDLGFRPERAVALRIDPDSSYDTQEKRNSYFNEALRRAMEIPGVEAAGLSDALPLGRNRTWGIGAKGQVYAPNDFPEAFVRIVSDGYFAAMGIPLRRGRDFTPGDALKSQKVIIVNETMARALWPGQDPLGQLTDGDQLVIGIVGDVRHLALEQGAGSEMYLPIRQGNDYSSVDLVVRSSLSTAELARRLREALLPIAPDLPNSSLRPLESLVDKALSPRRLVVVLLAGFAVFALVLASLGIYAVISYSVSQRTQEIGIRMALGASAGAVETGILLETLRLGGLGMAIGILASWLFAAALRSLLFGVSAADPGTFLAMLVILTMVAAMGGYFPARRASRIDPFAALRAD